MKRTLSIIAAVFALALTVTLIGAGCGKKAEPEPAPSAPPAPTVSVRPAAASRTMTRELTFPGTVAAEVETTLVAKAAGTVRGLDTALGKTVAIGQEIATINDSDAGAVKTNALSTTQVKQAELGVSQALKSYQLAQSNYATLVESSAKDLATLDVARRQAATGLSGLGKTTAEQHEAAAIARDTAATALEQAKLALDSRKTQIAQSEADAKQNARLAADNAVDSCGSALVSMDDIAALNGVEGLLPYGSVLGLRKGQSYDDAKNAWKKAKASVDAYRKSTEADPVKRLAQAETVVKDTKAMADATKVVFDYTPPSSALPLTSAVGASISAFQQSVAALQSQMNGLVTQITNVRQGLDTLALADSSSIASMEKNVELATKQLEAAEQNMKSLEAGTQSQIDQAAFGREAAERQYAATKTKIDGQLTAAKSQSDLARLQYENAVTALDGLIDSRRVYSSLSGTVTHLFVENGETVSAGSPVATISTTDRILVATYVDQATVADLRPGVPATIMAADGTSASGTVLTVSPVADPATKRFKVEIKPGSGGTPLLLGLVVSIKLPITHDVAAPKVLIPLSSVDVTNDGSFFYVVRDGKAVRLSATLGAIFGETTEASSPDLKDDDLLIINGAKIAEDGGAVTIGE
jgi:multidrug efflux pump subunit AcrA (membrane-fusion protein)